MIVISKEDLIRKKFQMNEVQNFANFHTCYLPYGLKFFHKGHPKHKLNYSWPYALCLDKVYRKNILIFK